MATLYDVGLLTYVGCPTYGNEAAKVFGDDIDFRAQALEVDLAGFPAMLFMLRRAGSGRSAINRALEAAAFMATGGRAVVEQMASHCSAAGALADRLGLGADVRAGIEQAYARWDGRGVPDTLSGTGLSLAARISHVAEACEVFERTAGVDAAVDMVRSRSGTHFDPEIATAAATDPGSLFDGIGENTVEEIVAAEPIERANLTDDELDAALEAIGDFCDLRVPVLRRPRPRHGHPGRGRAPNCCTCRRPRCAWPTVRRSCTTSAGSGWTRRCGRSPGRCRPPSASGCVCTSTSSSGSSTVPQPLRRIGLLAATHHERLDGSGYHRGVGAAMLSAPARLLAAADAYHAMRAAPPVSRRPHRGRRPRATAGRRRAGTAGRRVGRRSVDRGGAPHGRAHTEGPMGLTARENEVLGLLAQGLPNKSVAKRLGISPKTVSNHLERVYTKLGVDNRAGGRDGRDAARPALAQYSG